MKLKPVQVETNSIRQEFLISEESTLQSFLKSMMSLCVRVKGHINDCPKIFVQF